MGIVSRTSLYFGALRISISLVNFLLMGGLTRRISRGLLIRSMVFFMVMVVFDGVLFWLIDELFYDFNCWMFLVFVERGGCRILIVKGVFELVFGCSMVFFEVVVALWMCFEVLSYDGFRVFGVVTRIVD